MTATLEFKNVDILFARERGRQGAAQIKAALESLDAGRNRSEIAAERGVVVGVADASLTVERGHISVSCVGPVQPCSKPTACARPTVSTRSRAATC